MIGIAVIGLGNALSPHAKSLADLRDRARVVWGVARNAAQRQAAATAWGWPVRPDAAGAIADPAVDAVMILTPANAHLEFAQAAFAAGRHVLCEKPLEVSLPRAEALVAAGRAANRHLGMMLQLRFREASRRLKAILDGGGLGEIQAATMTVAWWRAQSYYDEPGRGVRARDGGGVMMTQAIHTLDLLRWLVGIDSVQAAQVRTTALHRMETEDFATALFRLGNGAPGSMVATVAAYPGRPESLLIIGTRGVARMDGASLRVSYLDGTEDVVEDAAGSGSGGSPMAFSYLAHRAVISDFLDAIEQGRDPAIPGEEALATQRVIDMIIEKGG